MYLGYQGDKIKFYVAEQLDSVMYNITKWEETEDEYVMEDDTWVIKDAEWEERERQRKRAELDAKTLTPADIERALYKAKGMDFEDLKVFIHEQLPTLDIKGIAIEFRAKDFWRGAKFNGMKLFDVVGQLLGYTSEDMDYLFEHKELPPAEGEVL